jgi:predicted nucleic acid-binding protein
MTGRFASARIERVFVDTAAFFARADRDDEHFVQAQVIQQQLTADRAAWITSNYVVAETHALFLSRTGIRSALEFIYRLRQSNTTIVRATEEDDERAVDILRRYDDKDFSFTDATSFVIMERLGIRHAFTFDQHFAQYGFQILSTA